jgi:hypothetical protein
VCVPTREIASIVERLAQATVRVVADGQLRRYRLTELPSPLRAAAPTIGSQELKLDIAVTWTDTDGTRRRADQHSRVVRNASCWVT